LEVWCGIARRGARKLASDEAGPIPEYDGVLDTVVQGVKWEELEVDMDERGPVEADQESGFAYVFAGEGREQRAKRRRESEPVIEHVWPVSWCDHDDEIQVGELIECSADEGSPRSKSDDARVSTHALGDPDQQRSVEIGKSRRPRRFRKNEFRGRPLHAA